MAYLISALLVLLSGTFSGLTIGLMRLDVSSLRRKAALGDEEAAAILPLRRSDNRLLVSLLIGNVAVNSVLAVYLGSITTGLIASILSTLLIAIFGDILPQAYFTLHTQRLTALVVPVTRLVLWFFAPIAIPVAWVLDRVLGTELPSLHSREEILQIVQEHRSRQDGTINAQEEAIVKGALSFSTKRIREVMVPKQRVTVVHEEDVLTKQLLARLRRTGHSRFPVVTRSNPGIVTKMLSLKHLAGKDLDAVTVGELAEPQVFFVNELLLLDDALNAFARTKSHLYVVVDEHKQMTGVLSLEDILAEILGHKIFDDFTSYDSLARVARRPTPSISKETE